MTDVGANGGPAGMIGGDAADSGPDPTPLVACTVKVYVAPLLRPETVPVVAFPATVVEAPPGEAVMMYEEMVLPLFPGVPSGRAAAGCHEMVAD